MITTTYSCDRCTHKQSNDGGHTGKPGAAKNLRRLARVSIYARWEHRCPSIETPIVSVLFCEPCCGELGLKVGETSFIARGETTESIEDLIREICRDEIEDS